MGLNVASVGFGWLEIPIPRAPKSLIFIEFSRLPTYLLTYLRNLSTHLLYLLPAYLPIYAPTHAPTYLPTHLRAFATTYLRCLPTHLRTYASTYLRAVSSSRGLGGARMRLNVASVGFGWLRLASVG